MTMLQGSIGLFFIAATLGFYLLTLVLRKKETRKGLALIHGPVAAIALILLICHELQSSQNERQGAIGIFILTALGGVVMIVRDLKGHKPPRWLAVLHGALAVIALLLILF